MPRRDPSAIERALRKLPLPYSLALRLRDAGVAPEVVSEYIGVEVDALDGIYRMAEAKFEAAVSSVGDAWRRWPLTAAILCYELHDVLPVCVDRWGRDGAARVGRGPAARRSGPPGGSARRGLDARGDRGGGRDLPAVDGYEPARSTARERPDARLGDPESATAHRPAARHGPGRSGTTDGGGLVGRGAGESTRCSGVLVLRPWRHGRRRGR